MLLVTAPLHDITALHWLHTAEISSCLVKCSQALDRLLLFMMPPRSRLQVGVVAESVTQMYRDAKFPENRGKARAGGEMRESLRRIDNVGGGQLEPVLSRNRFSIPTPTCHTILLPSAFDRFMLMVSFWAASLANLSTFLFVAIPTWAGTHTKDISTALLSTSLIARRISYTRSCRLFDAPFPVLLIAVTESVHTNT